MTRQNLTAMVASRICHDLISPIGAIRNGLELLSLSGGSSPELDLINDSVSDASSRIRFFRLAFGAPGTGQTVPARELQTLCRDLGRPGRHSYAWQAEEPVRRDLVQCIALAMLCVETALPRGGTVAATCEGDGSWAITGEGASLRCEPAVWALLTEPETAEGVTPAAIQFLLLPAAVTAAGHSLRVETGTDRVLLGF